MRGQVRPAHPGFRTHGQIDRMGDAQRMRSGGIFEVGLVAVGGCSRAGATDENGITAGDELRLTELMGEISFTET